MSEFKMFTDIVEVAIRIERQAVTLYQKLSQTATNPNVKDAMSYLAAQEEKHAGVFRQILEDVAEYTPRYDYPGEKGLFMNETAATFLKAVEEKVKDISPQDIPQAMEAGMELEKESIRLYSSLMNEEELVAEKKDVLQHIIDEEKSHLKQLQVLKDSIEL